MNRMILGALLALALAGIGLFWLQGRAAVERGAPPPLPSAAPASGLPTADIAGLQGPAPPEASELSKEERRFFRYDRDHDRRITREEMLASRTDAFRKLDRDGNNLLTFEEWAVKTSDKFAGADLDRDGQLSPPEFATTAPKRAAKPRCNC